MRGRYVTGLVSFPAYINSLHNMPNSLIVSASANKKFLTFTANGGGDFSWTAGLIGLLIGILAFVDCREDSYAEFVAAFFKVVNNVGFRLFENPIDYCPPLITHIIFHDKNESAVILLIWHNFYLLSD